MSDLRARVAYLQGLVEGLDVEHEGPQGRVLAEIVQVLGDVAETVIDVQEHQVDLEDYIEEMDQDLTDLFGDVYQQGQEEGGQEAEEGEEVLGELCCPHCGTTLALEAGELNGREALSVVCPACGIMVGTSNSEEGEKRH